MKKLKYLLVCEGPTDVAFLKRLANKLGKDLGAEVTLQELSPQRDATTGTWPAHGWSAVRTWCKSWSTKTAAELESIQPQLRVLAQRRTWKALVQNSADGLIIQMDTDIAEQITDLSPRFTASTLSRRDYCEMALCYWLNEAATSTNKPVFLLPSYAMETWLLAIHSSTSPIFSDLGTNFNYESIIDLETRLINLGYSSKRKKGVLRLKKDDALYIDYADQVYTNFQLVKSRCAEAHNFYEFIKNSIRNLP